MRIHSHTDQTKAYESAYASMLSLLKDIQGIQRQKERMQEELARMKRLLENCKVKEETVDRESDEEEVDKHKEITESAGEVFRQLRSRLRTEKSKTSRLSIELNRATIELDALRSQTDKLKEEHRKRLKRIQRKRRPTETGAGRVRGAYTELGFRPDRCPSADREGDRAVVTDGLQRLSPSPKSSCLCSKSSPKITYDPDVKK